MRLTAMMTPFKELAIIKKMVNKQKNYVVCQFCSKPILVEQMVRHMAIHKEI